MKVNFMSLSSRCLLCTMIVLSTFLLTGCWNYREIDKDAIARVFVDGYDADGKPEFGVEFQTPVKGSQGQEGGSQQASPTVVRSTGATFYEAVKNLSESVPNKISYSHLIAAIFSDKVARSDDFQTLLDRITRSSMIVRRRIMFFLTSEKVNDILNVKIPLSTNVGEGLSDILNEAKQQQYSPRIDLNDFLYELSTPGIQPILPRVFIRQRAEGQNDLEVAGSGAFRGNRFVGWLSGDETRGVLWVRGETGHAVFTTPWKGEKVTVKTEEIHSRIIPPKRITAGSRPQFVIQIQWQGTLEMYSGMNKLESKDVTSMQKGISLYIEKTVQKSIRRAQRLKSDVFGFGNSLYCKRPKEFVQLYQGQWDTKGFPQVRFLIQVEPVIRGSGFTTSPPKDMG